jgi:hypothetical protein
LGKAGHEKVGVLNRHFDGARPVLAWQQRADVDPRPETGLAQSIVQPERRLHIFLGISDEDRWAGAIFKTDAQKRIEVKHAQSFHFHGLSAGQ